MLSRMVKDGDTFIVFDLEWNQPIPGKEYGFDVSALTGEIIEIGAEKLVYSGGTLISKGIFSCDIKPACYRSIHYHVKKVTHKTNADLAKGIPFPVAYKKFREFMGDDAILAGWGNSDPDMLKMNLKFFGLDDKLGMFFLDVQPLFSVFSTEKGRQRSVEFAVDYYNVPKEESFHSATSDAKYTAQILRNIFDRNQTSEVLSVISSSSVNCDIKREYTTVGSACERAPQALSMVSGFNCKCPVCGSPFEIKIEPFRIRKSLYALYNCKTDGEFFGRTRIKKNKDGKYYAAAVLRFATQPDYFLVASKKEEFEKFGSEGEPVKKEEPTEDGEDVATKSTQLDET